MTGSVPNWTRFGDDRRRGKYRRKKNWNNRDLTSPTFSNNFLRTNVRIWENLLQRDFNKELFPSEYKQAHRIPIIVIFWSSIGRQFRESWEFNDSWNVDFEFNNRKRQMISFEYVKVLSIIVGIYNTTHLWETDLSQYKTEFIIPRLRNTVRPVDVSYFWKSLIELRLARTPKDPSRGYTTWKSVPMS